MKRLFLTAGLLSALASSCLFAQTMNLSASIPFDFQVGSTRMPAGTYSIKHTAGIIYLREQTGHASAMHLTMTTSRSDTPALGVLNFNRYGDTYFLSNVWTPGSKEGRTVRKGSQELELAARTRTVESAGVTLQTK